MVYFQQSQKAIQDSTIWGLTKDHSLKKNNTDSFQLFPLGYRSFYCKKTDIIHHSFFLIFKIFCKYIIYIQIYKGIFHYLKIKLTQLLPIVSCRKYSISLPLPIANMDRERMHKLK